MGRALQPSKTSLEVPPREHIPDDGRQTALDRKRVQQVVLGAFPYFVLLSFELSILHRSSTRAVMLTRKGSGDAGRVPRQG